jgi:hypothetical protein
VAVHLETELEVRRYLIAVCQKNNRGVSRTVTKRPSTLEVKLCSFTV